MARGVKALVDYDAQINTIDSKIERHTQNIAALKEKKQELLSKKRSEDMAALQGYMASKGLTSAQVLSVLEAKAGQ
ncbi:MAG: hypothetical protein VB023_06380 [Oscillibacter sp.]|nr:hypothetical protein [Oscillibacter sp.]